MNNNVQKQLQNIEIIINQRMKSSRKTLGISINELAQFIGVSSDKINKYEQV